MSPRALLVLFVCLRLAQQLAETTLARVNRRYATTPARLEEAARGLEIPEEEMRKAVAYSSDRHRFSLLSGWVEVVVVLTFLVAGGLGAADQLARRVAAQTGWTAAGLAAAIATGLVFFAVLGLLSGVLALPFDLYSTFRIEQRHGFNRQTLRGFVLDRLKGLLLGIVLGAPFLAGILSAMERLGPWWWVWAWALVVGFNLLAVWIYPTVLAPLFNRFTPLPAGELREGILALAERTGFRPGGIFVMDASRRTAHGNAYFTGLFGQKRIVLFDTLLEAMGVRETVAVLAHELGHFKLHHVRWAILRSVAASGVLFFLLSRVLPVAVFYQAFSVERSSHAALVVFGLWFGLVGFLLQPLENAISRRQEFAADAFALRSGASGGELGSALRRLRERSKLLPLSHPLYSRVYHSHPPLLERLRAMGALQ
ncbi:MAG TPA: M48 family metallopeptidase [Vicinamibacteria bacterium]|nr:M48 family metallopeptidase [Vicinamibacteria bacterium]